MKSVEGYLKVHKEAKMREVERLREIEEQNKLIDPKQALEDEKERTKRHFEALKEDEKEKVRACADCESERQNQLKHLNHPFYQEVREYKEDIAFGQIIKGAEKYPNPFIPDQWTGDELANHAMQEMHDGSVYITGMRDRMRKQDAAYNNLLKDYNELKDLREWDVRHIREFVRFVVENFPESVVEGASVTGQVMDLLRDYNETKTKFENLKKFAQELIMDNTYKTIEISKQNREIIKLKQEEKRYKNHIKGIVNLVESNESAGEIVENIVIANVRFFMSDEEDRKGVFIDKQV